MLGIAGVGQKWSIMADNFKVSNPHRAPRINDLGTETEAGI